jgi:hypothetical protein
MTATATANNLTRYQRETLDALYASLDYLNCYDLPGVTELTSAIEAIEAQA